MNLYFLLPILYVLLADVRSIEAISFGRSDIDYCEEKSTKIQMVLALDRTGTFRNSYQKIFESVYRDLINAVEKKYPGSQFSVVAFSDYDQASTPLDGGTGRAEYREEWCYQVIEKFVMSAQVISEAIGHIEQGYGWNNGGESSLTATLFAAADKTLGWITEPVDPTDGKTVRKIIVLATDETSTRKLGKQGVRQPPKGDGTDKCATTLPPNDAILEKTLKDNDISVIGLYTPRSSEAENGIYIDLLEYYNNIFGRMGIEYNQYVLDTSSTNKIIENLLTGISNTVECEEEDPPAYNTLGL
ncbi:hypothetical protein Ocin01_13366 [Orchesella cincta]|uniref:VWFA domain-containing protein n=1 Tax=Orchesella cincta TaxID=48709 RepID=A0A1D2MJR7_ORCCI|nr:hypothetical protein Ocin01_13366 [Orchesella cincta]